MLCFQEAVINRMKNAAKLCHISKMMNGCAVWFMVFLCNKENGIQASGGLKSCWIVVHAESKERWITMQTS